MNSGSVIDMTSFEQVADTADGGVLRAKFKAERGCKYRFMLLGVEKPGAGLDPDLILRNLAWIPEPDVKPLFDAAKALDEYWTAQTGTGAEPGAEVQAVRAAVKALITRMDEKDAAFAAMAKQHVATNEAAQAKRAKRAGRR